MTAVNAEPAKPSTVPWTRRALTFLFWAVIFGVSCTQARLYYSNQNQYFLHGLAKAGHGHLGEDWLANTKDPTPIFSAVVTSTFRFLHESLFYVYYLLVFGLYFHSLVGIFQVVTDGKTSPTARLAFLTMLVLVHAGLLRLASAHLLGVDYPWYAQAGVAGQYLLGFGLQPSVTGVFLLASLHAFLRDRGWRATIWAALAGILHGTYLLGAALLILSYMYLHYRRGRLREALLQGLLALVLVAPVVFYNLVSFGPSSADQFAQAQHVLAHFRIPHHAEPERWFDAIALAQVIWILLAMVLVRGCRLFVIMLITFFLSSALTLVQLWTANDTLALLFPWRTSATLVPLATAIVLAKVATGLDPWLRRLSTKQAVTFKVACGSLLGLLVAGGVAIFVSGYTPVRGVAEWGYRTNQSELSMMEFVRDHKGPGEVYLLPVSLPKTESAPRGAFSTNFTPAPRAGKSGHLIAIDLQRFRLFTGAPIFVDFKSIPYKDTDVLEWHRRLLWAHNLYAQRDWSGETVIQELTENGITHVVTTADRDIHSSALEKVYGDTDANYRVYRLPTPKAVKPK